MPGVRALTRDDIPRLAEMHLQGFPGNRSRDDVESFLTTIMFDHPWVDDRLPSLGYDNPRGKLIGCVGVMPRPMVMNDEPVKAAISNNFIVDPDGQPGLAAFALMRSLRDAGADLILGEANEAARKICERLGWFTVRERSSRWLRPLRPAALGVKLLEGSRLPPGAARLLRRISRMPDTLVARVPGSPLRMDVPAVEDAPLDGPRLLELITRVGHRFALRPSYDEASLAWLFDTLGRTRRPQMLRGGIVPSEDGKIVGWYLYYSRPGGLARVLQLGAEDGHRGRVLRHLFHDAWQNENNAVTGQTDPGWTDDLVASSCFFREGGSWLIAHSPDSATRRTVSGKDAFMSRLETEAWITFAF
jgi:hypothetical protein